MTVSFNSKAEPGERLMNKQCELEEQKVEVENHGLRFQQWRSNRFVKAAALYLSMVIVSTTTIFWLEHATLLHALRTALIAAVGKSVAASWVVQIFD